MDKNIRCLKIVTSLDLYDYIIKTLDDAQATFGKNYKTEISRNRTLEMICRLYWELKENGQL
jgi:hypothetical protein